MIDVYKRQGNLWLHIDHKMILSQFVCQYLRVGQIDYLVALVPVAPGHRTPAVKLDVYKRQVPGSAGTDTRSAQSDLLS